MTSDIASMTHSTNLKASTMKMPVVMSMNTTAQRSNEYCKSGTLPLRHRSKTKSQKSSKASVGSNSVSRAINKYCMKNNLSKQINYHTVNGPSKASLATAITRPKSSSCSKSRYSVKSKSKSKSRARTATHKQLLR